MNPGDVVANRFRIEREAGSGGMGRVFRANDLVTGATVAVKVLHGSAARDPERFEREAQLLDELRHPGIVRYIAHGRAPTGEPWLAMEWLEGEDLHDRLAREPLTLSETITFVSACADALAHAHARRVVHRDIKPTNIFLKDRRVDQIRILDFGLARNEAPSRPATQSGVWLGTPGYIAPEQARGVKELDARADVFSLGCVFFECLTGRPAFVGHDVMALLTKILFEEAPRVIDLVPEMPPELDALVARMLAKDRASRPADGAVVLAELAAFSANTVAAWTTKPPQRAMLERVPIEPVRTLLGRQSPCVGRERELGTLGGVWDACVAEPVARAVLVTAPAGIGKSRLRYEFLRKLRERGAPHQLLIGRGDPSCPHAPYRMLALAVRATAGILEGEPLTVQRQKLRARVERTVAERDVERVSRFLGELAVVPFGDDDAPDLRAARQDPMLMGDQIRRAFEDWLTAESDERPVLLVFEDMHWGDLGSIRLIDGALRNVRDRPWMLLALARPDVRTLFPKLWAGRAVTEMELGRVTRKAAAKLVSSILGDSFDPAEASRLVERSSGNALHLEEMLRAIAAGSGDDQLPSVERVFEARVDRLPEAHFDVLAAASVLGNVFWRGAVRAVAGEPPGRRPVGDLLGELVAHEFVTRRGRGRFAGEEEYVFRHAVLRDVIYARLTPQVRGAMHRRAAEWLERSGEGHPAVIADQWDLGGDPQRSIVHHRHAAERALEASDFEIALARARRGIGAGAKLESLGALWLLQAEAHWWRHEFDDAETCAIEAMRRLPRRTPLWYRAAGDAAGASVRVGNHDQLARLAALLDEAPPSRETLPSHVVAATRLIEALFNAGKYELASALLDRLVASEQEIVDASPPPPPAARDVASRPPTTSGLDLSWAGPVLARLDRARAIREIYFGDPGDALNYFESAARRFEAFGDLRNACIQRANVGYASMEIGNYEDAERALRSALDVAQQTGLDQLAALARHNLGLTLARRARFAEAVEVTTSAVRTAADLRDARLEGASRIYLSIIRAAAGDLEAAEREARAAVDVLEMQPPTRTYALAQLAHVQLERGRTRDALQAATESMRVMEQLGSIDDGEALVRLVHAEALQANGEDDAAVRAIRAARDRLLARAETIRDPTWRESFFHNVPENARTLELARLWMLRPASPAAG
jgi:ATP/maltotriose-dependent transcriptional regulator MalT